jgi:hypothetical protein
MTALILLAILLHAGLSLGKTTTVKAAPSGPPTYVPSSVTADKGDTVKFEFYPRVVHCLLAGCAVLTASDVEPHCHRVQLLEPLRSQRQWHQLGVYPDDRRRGCLCSHYHY